MATQPFEPILQYVRKVALAQTLRRLSDRELLGRFVEAHDEAAFAVLIERHGPMMLGVCRRTLPSFHDAEDACQASFLVLARKAYSIRKRASLGSWLHGVAYRSAAKLTRNHARRAIRERGAATQVPKDPATEVSWRETLTILDDELLRLPTRYRDPLILCYLQCLTRDEAAQRLGLSSGSLHGRLERARRLLRNRLTNRGLTLSAILSATLLRESASQAGLAPMRVVASSKAAVLLVAGTPLSKSGLATTVIALTQEVLKSMLLSNVKLGTVAVLCTSLAAALISSSFTARGIAQDGKLTAQRQTNTRFPLGLEKAEGDADFIRRISKDLRSSAPTPAEIHFFVANTDAGKRQTLIDLFIQERQAKAASLDNELPHPLRFVSMDGVRLKPTMLFQSSLSAPPQELWPTKAEVLLALPGATRVKKLHYNCLTIDHNFDDPRVYPLVGIAQLERARFKCTLVSDNSSDVVYISHERLVPRNDLRVRSGMTHD